MANAPLINILIRTTGGRDKELDKCILSISDQTYRNVKIVICTDAEQGPARPYFFNPKIPVEIFMVKSTGVPYHWNFYCNNLKERVTAGWFFYLDDDDYLVDPHCLSIIADHLTDPRLGVICQFNRGSKPKPDFNYLSDFYRSDNSGTIRFSGGHIETNTIGTFCVRPEAIIRGRIGGSCIFLHHSQKDIAAWDGKRAADYRFIKAVSEKIPLKFVPVVVVQAGNNGRHGK